MIPEASLPVYGGLPRTNCYTVVMARRQKYTVTDGKLTLDLYPAEEGGYVVQGTFDRALLTQGETIEEAFENARDAAKTLAEGRGRVERDERGSARRKAAG